jgi:hypothetical protein
MLSTKFHNERMLLRELLWSVFRADQLHRYSCLGVHHLLEDTIGWISDRWVGSLMLNADVLLFWINKHAKANRLWMPIILLEYVWGNDHHRTICDQVCPYCMSNAEEEFVQQYCKRWCRQKQKTAPPWKIKWSRISKITCTNKVEN